MTIPTQVVQPVLMLFFHGAVEQSRTQMVHLHVMESICVHFLMIPPGGGVNSGSYVKNAKSPH
jgi:hypothetical protein